MSFEPLTSLEVGQRIPYGGDRLAVVGEDLARSFGPGDRLVVVQETGDLLRIPREVSALVDDGVARARAAFTALSTIEDSRIDQFYDELASRLADDSLMAPVQTANELDVDDARSRGRSVNRLQLSEKMRNDMITGVRLWRQFDVRRDMSVAVVEHDSWRVEERRAPLGVVAFVFEGRPNVFADATGVLRSGNSVVFRIGSDALRTATALMDGVVRPSLDAAGLPHDCVVLIESPERSAGYALFADRRVALAVARGSGEAVAQLGAVARQTGVPVSLHGTGGAWITVAEDAEPSSITAVVDASLDRKVCNTMNVACVLRSNPHHLLAVIDGIRRSAARRGERGVLHLRSDDMAVISAAANDSLDLHEHDGDDFLATEHEWDERPECSIRLVESVPEAISLFNRRSPWFVASILTSDDEVFADFYRRVEAPFVGDGFTRWVDGQYALQRPELGLSNWQSGRLFGRSGILSGDGVFSVRYVARHRDAQQRR